MAYTINHKDNYNASSNPNGKNPITVSDGTINTSTSLSLVGKNYYGYGEAIAENFLHLLENFSNTDDSTRPANPVQGQLYFRQDSKSFEQFDGTQWTGLNIGGLMGITIKESGSTTYHPAVAAQISGTYVAIISAVAQYTVDANDPVYATFTQINPGINLNPTNSRADFKLHGRAIEAEYADLAEMYSSDADYEPGTVVKIGGEKEVTQTTEAFDPEVFGIVSTDPAYLMNSMADGVAVALEGRVPCKVIGPVRKGQRLVSSEEAGVARAVSDYERQEALDWYRIVGRALEDKTSEGTDLVQVVVGTK
jgi:hypothetical protein